MMKKFFDTNVTIFLTLVVINYASAVIASNSTGGICKFLNVSEVVDYCRANRTTNCFKKCTDLNLSPSYSCKIPQTNCTLQCRCDYFNSSFAETNITKEFIPPSIKNESRTQKDECTLFGESICKPICSNATNYCQVTVLGGPKTCGCHHWVKGDTLVGAYNDFIYLNESLYSKNGLYELKVIDYWHLNVTRTNDSTVVASLEGVPTNEGGDRFTLKNDETFIQQSTGHDFNGVILEELLMKYVQFDGSAYLKMENCGYAIFYDKNMKRVKVLGTDFADTYNVCPDVNKPDK